MISAPPSGDARDGRVGTGSTSPPLTFEVIAPHTAEARAVLERFYADIIGRYRNRPASPADVARVMLDEPSDDLHGDGGFLLVVRDGARVVGCGGVRTVGPGVGELTRVFLGAEIRGRGAGRLLIAELERLSRRRGTRMLRLTVRDDLTEARRLYRRAGYEPVEPFSTSPYADHFLAKTLAP